LADDLLVRVLGVLSVLALLSVLYQHLRVNRTRFLATETEAEVSLRLAGTRSERMELSAIKDIDFARSARQMVVGIGDLLLRNTTGKTLPFFNLDDPVTKRDTSWDLITNSQALGCDAHGENSPPPRRIRPQRKLPPIMNTFIALPTEMTPISPAGEQFKDMKFAALVEFDEARAIYVLEFVMQVRHVRQHRPEAWQLYILDDDGPVYVPASALPDFGGSNYLLLPGDFTPPEILEVAGTGTSMLASSEGVSWETMDATGTLRLNTKELDAAFLRLIAHGVPLGEGAERGTVNVDLASAFLFDQRTSMTCH